MAPVNALSFTRYWHALEWLLASPPLACPSASAQHWPGNLGSFWPDHSAQLQTLKNQPETLLAWMAKQPDRRLGSVFEQLLAFWLHQQAHLQILATNLQVHETGRTLGALDFLLLDRRDGKIWHWEVACKFYLQAPLPNGGWQWLGPGKQDSLEKKLRHMQTHQLPMSEHPYIRQWLAEQGYRGEIHRLGYVWGRLFYAEQTLAGHEPLPLHPQHPRGRWFRQPAPPGWQPASKMDLLTPQLLPASHPAPSPSQPYPVVRTSTGSQPEWGFAVPANW